MDHVNAPAGRGADPVRPFAAASGTDILGHVLEGRTVRPGLFRASMSLW